MKVMPVEKLKKKRKSSLKTLKTQAWSEFARYIRRKYKTCVTCPEGSAENCGHFRPNSERNQALGGNMLWYDERNFGGQCVGCNKWRNGEQAKYALFVEKTYGYGILQEMNRLLLQYRKWTREEITMIRDHYKYLNENQIILETVFNWSSGCKRPVSRTKAP